MVYTLYNVTTNHEFIPSTKPSLHPDQMLIVFDWDDTIMCSSWLIQSGMLTDCSELPITISPSTQAQCNLLAAAATALIVTAKKYGTIVIVTNSIDNWVIDSCELFLPTLLPVLSDIPIVSAKEQYCHLDRAPTYWKYIAFYKIFKHYIPSGIRGMISIGDGIYERDALKMMRNSFAQCKSFPSCHCCSLPVLKSIKCIERPNISQLILQLNKLTEICETLILTSIDLDLRFNDPDTVEKE